MSWWAGEQHLNSQKWFVQMNLTQPQSPKGHVHSPFTSNKTSFCQTTRLFCYTFSLILDRAPSRGNMSRAELQLTWCFFFVSPQSRVANNHHQLSPTCYPHPAIMSHDTCGLTCCLLHFHQNKGSNLTWRVHLPMGLYPSITICGLNNFEGSSFPKTNVSIISLW